VTSSREPSPEARALLDGAACGLLQTSEDGRIRRANRTFCVWVGRTSDELVGRRFQDLLTMGGRIFHQTHWAPLLQMQGSLSEVKLDIMHADGTTVPMVLNALRREEDGAVVHELAAFVARDRDKYERELLAARKRVGDLHEQAEDRAVFAEQMIGIVSHDLRNPLSSILMATALLAPDVSPTQERLLTKISRATDRANSLIGDLLDFTQARLGNGLPISPAPIELHAVVAEAFEELVFAYPARKLVHVRSGEGPCSADANRLAQLIGNLVSNAVVYGSPGSAITVTSKVDAAAFSVAVHNDGAPIPAASQRDLFRPMTRGADATNSGRSVGLGLFIVREIARAHGGNASVESREGEGTTFTATFPRA
jgi:sigma-B regulation protein RsbU (phosphoserine phosphatase)